MVHSEIGRTTVYGGSLAAAPHAEQVQISQRTSVLCLCGAQGGFIVAVNSGMGFPTVQGAATQPAQGGGLLWLDFTLQYGFSPCAHTKLQLQRPREMQIPMYLMVHTGACCRPTLATLALNKSHLDLQVTRQ